MKVGIITIYKGNRNYGGLLQAYALQKFVSKQGHECELLSYVPEKTGYISRRMLNLGINRTLKIILKKINTKIRCCLDKRLASNISTRNTFFRQFEESIPHSPNMSDDEIDMFCQKYETLICGSDQVWNPALWNPYMFLDFRAYTGKRFSYAASLGRSLLTRKEKEYIAKHLNYMSGISVREESAEAIIRSLGYESVVTVLDPTYLLSAEEWKNFSRRPQGCPDEFVFSFFLGNNKEAKRIVKNHYAGQLPVVALPHLQEGYRKEDELYSDIQLYEVVPREWVWLLQNAQYVFTDSFHGTAFSINLGKEFLCFAKGDAADKQAIHSRLFDVTRKFGIPERFVSKKGDFEERVQEKIDYTSVGGLKANYLQASRQYLLKMLSD